MADKNTEDRDYMLLVVTFDGKDTAKSAMKVVKKLKKHKALELEDVVAASKNMDGKIKISQGKELTASKGAAYFGTAGLIAGSLLGGPLAGLAIGAAIGGGVGAATDKGFDNKDLKELAEELDRDASALIMVAYDVDEDAVDGAFIDFGGKMNAFLVAEDGLVVLGDSAVDEVYIGLIEDGDLVDVEDVDVDETAPATE